MIRRTRAARWPRSLSSFACAAALAACASSATSRHGTPSALSQAGTDAELCPHRIPREVCTRCHPELAARFQAAGDWCAEHGVPESQCYLCHPDLSFTRLPALREGADLVRLSQRGEDVPSLRAHAAPGKVTVFDFYADWCGPCRRIDAHLFGLLNRRDDLAVRKLNIVSWDTPLARHHLREVETLPYVVVYGRDGRPVRAITGLDLAALDRAIAEGGQR